MAVALITGGSRGIGAATAVRDRSRNPSARSYGGYLRRRHVRGEGALAELAGRIPVGRLGRPDEVGDLIAAIVRNPYLTNQSILVDGGIRPS
jgi:NAD(P)-dependent dehydrogenase (short-subunit alcohol dehydrogenase family)